MSIILSIDASTEACSVALINAEKTSVIYQLAPRQHAKLLLPMVDELLHEQALTLQQLDAITCLTGPGAFTGIRIAVSVTQGLAYGANLPVIGLSSLANLAALGTDKTQQTTWLCAIDARMNEVYFAIYSTVSGIPELIGKERVIAPELIDFASIAQQVDLSSVGLIGSGWQAYADILFAGDDLVEHKVIDNQLVKDALPNAKFSLKQAQFLFEKAETLQPAELQPTYLRNNVAVKKFST